MGFGVIRTCTDVAIQRLQHLLCQTTVKTILPNLPTKMRTSDENRMQCYLIYLL